MADEPRKASLLVIFLTVFIDLLGFGMVLPLLPIYAKDILRVGPGGLGVLQAALPMGSLLSAIILAHRPLDRGDAQICLQRGHIFSLLANDHLVCTCEVDNGRSN